MGNNIYEENKQLKAAIRELERRLVRPEHVEREEAAAFSKLMMKALTQFVKGEATLNINPNGFVHFTMQDDTK